MIVLSPLSNDAHGKSSHILHFTDALFLQFILFIQELIWNRFFGAVDELIKGLSSSVDLPMAQARDAACELSGLPGKSLGLFEARTTGEPGGV